MANQPTGMHHPVLPGDFKPEVLTGRTVKTRGPYREDCKNPRSYRRDCKRRGLRTSPQDSDENEQCERRRCYQLRQNTDLMKVLMKNWMNELTPTQVLVPSTKLSVTENAFVVWMTVLGLITIAVKACQLLQEHTENVRLLAHGVVLLAVNPAMMLQLWPLQMWIINSLQRTLREMQLV